MKILTLYVAYDDTEFDSEAECRLYEQEASDLIDEALNVYTFYDRDKNIIIPKCDSIEEYLEWFDMTTDDCEYIKVAADISRELHKFLYRNIGACVPEEKGFYKYNWDKDEWVSID